MADNIYDEIEIEDMTWDATLQLYHYPCPCGDRFEISLDDLREQETDIAIRVIYEVEDLPKPPEPEKEGKGQSQVQEEGLQQQQQQVVAAVA